MTSPGQPSPPGAVTGLSAYSQKTEEEWRQDQRDLILPHYETVNDFGSLIRGLTNAFVQGFGGNWEPLVELIDDILDPPDWLGIDGWAMAIFTTLNEIGQLFTGEEDADSGDLSSWVNAVLGRDISLANRVQAIEGKIGVGAEFFDNFNRGDDDDELGNGWTQGGAGQPLGIHDQAAQIKRDALPAEGTRWAKCPQLQSTNDFTVGAVIHPAGVSEFPYTVLFARSNDTLTAGICVTLSRYTTRIARYTRTGADGFNYTFLTGTGSKYYSNAATVQFKGEGTRLQVVIDNVIVHDIPNETTHTIGETWRTVGFAARCETAILAIPQYSGGLASFAMRSTVNLDAVQLAQSQSSDALIASNAAALLAGSANTTSGAANAAALAAQDAASDAANAALAAQEKADIAYANAQQWKDEFMVSSAGVALGKNEVDLGVVMDLPDDGITRTRKITAIRYGMKTNTGTIKIELRRETVAGVETTIWTTNISTVGVTKYRDNGIDFTVADGDYISCYVLEKTGIQSVLQCALIGVLLEA